MSGSGDYSPSTLSNVSNSTDVVECLAFSSISLCEAIVWCRRVIAILALIACLFIIFVIVALKKYKFLPQRLILYLTIATFFHTIHYTWSSPRVANMARMGELVGFCKFQGLYHILTAWIAFLWVCIITFNIFWITVFLKRTGKKFERVYIPVDLIPPIIFCVIPFTVDAYGPAGLWCWIPSRKDGETFVPGVALQFSLYYGPWLVLCIVMVTFLTAISCVIHYRLRKLSKGNAEYVGPSMDAQKNLWRDEIKPLMPYPWIYIATFVFPVINRLRLAIGFNDPESPAHFALWFLHAISLPLPGLLFALVIVFDKQIMCDLKRTLHDWCQGNKGGKAEAGDKKEPHELAETEIKPTQQITQEHETPTKSSDKADQDHGAPQTSTKDRADEDNETHAKLHPEQDHDQPAHVDETS